jgi:glycosyltransferase involved in cell wall biosynthesis
LAKAIAKQPRGHEVIVLLNAAIGQPIERLRAQFEGCMPASQVVTWEALAPSAQVNAANAFRSRASEVLRLEALRALQPDVVHVASLVEGLADDVISSTPSAPEAFGTAATLYDLIPLVHREAYLADDRVRRWYMEKIEHLRRTELLLGISQYSCDEANQLLDIPRSRLVDISGAADDIFQPIAGAESFRSELMSRYGLARPFVMYTGGFDTRKNIAALIRAFSRLPLEVRHSRQLVVVGGAPEPERQALLAILKSVGLASHEVVFTGYVPDDDLVMLYNLCELYVFPSLHEGFGLPALEAMSSGAIVIGANASSLPEVIGHADALFDPHSVDAIAAKMLQALTDSSLRDELRRHGLVQPAKFSWGESARRALGAFEHLVERRSTTRVVSAPSPMAVDAESVAWLPAPTGLTASRVVAGATIYADFPVEVEGVSKVHPLSRLESNPAQHARIVVELADNPYCARTLELALSGAADVEPRDRSFGAVWQTWAADSERRRDLVSLIYRSGGYKALEKAVSADFSAHVLAELVDLASLSSLRRCQLVTGEGLNFHRWRDRIRDTAATLQALPDARNASEADWKNVALSIARNQLTTNGTKQWLVDISNLFVTDAGTGIQRVVRHVLKELLAAPPAGYRVEPVYLDDHGELRYARSYCGRHYFPEEQLPPDEPVEFLAGDLYLGLDLAAHLIPSRLELFRGLRNRGVLLSFVVYDLLPILRPDCFRPELLPMFQSWYGAVADIADSVMCISRSVADEFEVWLNQTRPQRERPLHIGYFHLGADLEVAGDVGGKLIDHPRASHLGSGPTFLMVGTIEPRKGHAQAISAFERLWERNAEVNLLIVGQPGWLSDRLISRLRKHPENGRRLLWVDDADDEFLLRAYRGSAALLMASEGEGFGLPLIEAARHGLPLVARDLPVFREIAGDAAYYFSGDSAQALGDSIQSWLTLHTNGAAPASGTMRWLTWRESSAELKTVLLDQAWVHVWHPGGSRVFGADSQPLRIRVAQPLMGGSEATATGGGLVVCVPCASMSAGRYRVSLYGERRKGDGEITVGMSEGGVPPIIARMESCAVPPGPKGSLAVAELVLDQDVGGIAIRLTAKADTEAWVDHVVFTAVTDLTLDVAD